MAKANPAIKELRLAMTASGSSSLDSSTTSYSSNSVAMITWLRNYYFLFYFWTFKLLLHYTLQKPFEWKGFLECPQKEKVQYCYCYSLLPTIIVAFEEVTIDLATVSLQAEYSCAIAADEPDWLIERWSLTHTLPWVPLLPLLLTPPHSFPLLPSDLPIASMASVPRQLGSQTRAILELAEYGLGGCLLPVRVDANQDPCPRSAAVFIFKYEGGSIGHSVRKASRNNYPFFRNKKVNNPFLHVEKG